MNLHPNLHGKVLDSLILRIKESQTGELLTQDAARRAWEGLALELTNIGLNKTTSDALISWAKSQSDQLSQMPVRLRMLHPMEREFISSEAYGYMLELHYLGLITPDQLEQIIEACAMLSTLPARKEHIQKLVMKLFAEQMDVDGLNQSN